MIKMTFTNSGSTFTRVSKRTAKNKYVSGHTIVICPCNLRPFGAWHPEAMLNKSNEYKNYTGDEGIEKTFDSLVNSFEYYNCRFNETGKYASFYIHDKEE